MAPPRTDPALRIAERSVRIGECLIWTGAKHRDGYGSIGIGRGGSYRVHRVAWELSNGPIPSGMLVCHSCDTPLCVEISHLFLGTPKENTRDMWNKGRHPPLGKGESHPMCKLTDKEVSEIRTLRSTGKTLQYIASLYGISFQHVSSIDKGKVRANS